jgi:hypothetical protein
MSEKPQPLEISTDPGTVPDSLEVSAMIRDYAEPLLYADPAGPADVETIRTAMMLAMMCWNLPVYEAIGSPLFAQGVRTLDAITERVPRVVAVKLRKLIEDRKTRFAEVPYLVLVEVTGTTLKNATIVAEARLPKTASMATKTSLPRA